MWRFRPPQIINYLKNQCKNIKIYIFKQKNQFKFIFKKTKKNVTNFKIKQKIKIEKFI